MEEYKTYTDRVLTITPVLFGYRLHPFNLGHARILKGVGSNFINGIYNGFLDINNIINHFQFEALKVKADKTGKTEYQIINEFIFAVLVCSTTYDDFLKECYTGDIVNTIKEMQDYIEKNDVNFIEYIHTFAHYLHNGTQAPEYMLKDDDGDSVKGDVVPVEEKIKTTLMQNCGYKREECFNLPLTETLSEYLLYAYTMDKIKLLSKTEHDMLKGNN